jgi:raffinose/stachyose/melibiose transport system substrate-binding protein
MGTKRFRGHAALVCCVALTASLSACTNDDAGSGVTLRLAATSDANQTTIQQLIDAFESENPGITVETSYAPTDAFMTNTPRAMESDNGPDLVMAFPGVGTGVQAYPLQDAELIVDQSSADWVADLTEAQKGLLGHDGFIGFRPVGYDTIGVVYDESAFAEAGVKPATTWAELLDLCRNLRREGAGPMSFGLQTGFVTQFIPYALVSSTVYTPNPSFDEQQLTGEEKFSTAPGWSEAFRKLLELRDAGCFNKGYEGTTYDAMLQSVATGTTPMTVTVAPSLAAIRAANPDDKFSMFPLPAYDEAKKNGVPQALSVGLAINARGDNVAEAQRFVDFANRPKNVQTLASAYNVIPLTDEAPVPEGLNAMADAIRSGRIGPFPNQLWIAPGTVEAFMAGVQQLLAGKTTVDKLLQTLDSSYKTR